MGGDIEKIIAQLRRVSCKACGARDMRCRDWTLLRSAIAGRLALIAVCTKCERVQPIRLEL